MAKWPDKAVELFDDMLCSSAGIHFSIIDTPPLCPIAYTTVIDGFFALNEPGTALGWFDMMLQLNRPTLTGNNLSPYTYLRKPSQITWEALFDGLYSRKMVNRFN